MTLYVDGQPVVAERGEPVAVALVRAGRLAWARSPKFHRPRGPTCLRAACDGCLARVDDVPNVMTCRTPAADGMRVEAQNVVGAGGADLLRATDWLFPHGMNHHELWAGVPGVGRVLQSVARRISGLGKLPAHAGPTRDAVRREVDALVVGSGAAGAAVAVELSRLGRSVEVVDDALDAGGGARVLHALAGPGSREWGELLGAFDGCVREGRVALRLRTAAVGVYGDDVLVASERGVEVACARTLVLAPGAHDGVLVFEGNDLPGVFSVRAACAFAARGVRLGRRVVVSAGEPPSAFVEAYARADPAAVVVRARPVRAAGRSRVRAVILAGPSGQAPTSELRCDALVVDAPPAPAYELAAQTGAELSREARGFVVRAPGGKIRNDVFVAGEAAGTVLAPEAIVREARWVASSCGIARARG